MTCPSCAKDAPEGAAECPSCGVIFAKLKARAERATAEPAPAPAAKASSNVGNTLALLAALCVAVYGGYRIYERRVAPPPPEPKGALIDPEAHKADLLALEKAVYEGAGSVHETAAAAEAAASRVASRLLERGRVNPLARDAANDVLEFAGMMGAVQEPLGASSTARLEFVRAWETLRAKRFAQADWFHAAEAVKPGEAPDFERAAQRMLGSSRRLKALMESVGPELGQFGDEQVDLTDVTGRKMLSDAKLQMTPEEAKSRVERWRAWIPAWQARVDETLSDFPEPAEIPNRLEFPYRSLTRAVQAARQPPNPGPGAFVSAAELNDLYLPDKRSREAWVADVSRWLSELPAQVNGARQAERSPTP